MIGRQLPGLPSSESPLCISYLEECSSIGARQYAGNANMDSPVEHQNQVRSREENKKPILEKKNGFSILKCNQLNSQLRNVSISIARRLGCRVVFLQALK